MVTICDWLASWLALLSRAVKPHQSPSMQHSVILLKKTPHHAFYCREITFVVWTQTEQGNLIFMDFLSRKGHLESMMRLARQCNKGNGGFTVFAKHNTGHQWVDWCFFWLYWVVDGKSSPCSKQINVMLAYSLHQRSKQRFKNIQRRHLNSTEMRSPLTIVMMCVLGMHPPRIQKGRRRWKQRNTQWMTRQALGSGHGKRVKCMIITRVQQNIKKSVSFFCQFLYSNFLQHTVHSVLLPPP